MKPGRKPRSECPLPPELRIRWRGHERLLRVDLSRPIIAVRTTGIGREPVDRRAGREWTL
jgi:hypothetical protein